MFTEIPKVLGNELRSLTAVGVEKGLNDDHVVLGYPEHITKERMVTADAQEKEGRQTVERFSEPAFGPVPDSPGCKRKNRKSPEETGFQSDELIPLGVLAPNPALFPNRLHTFVAPNVERIAEVNNSSTEQTEVQLIPMAQLTEFLVSGEIDHALVAATLWRMLYFLKE